MPPEQTTSGLRGFILGLYRDKGYIGIMEKKVETTIEYIGVIFVPVLDLGFKGSEFGLQGFGFRV